MKKLFARRILKVIGISGTLLLCTSCFLAWVYWDGYYLPNQPCRPLGYPDGQTIEKNRWTDWDLHRIITTTDSLNVVLTFYDRRLDAKSIRLDLGQWRKEDLGNSRYLYSCHAADMNGITAESGCIMVSGDADRTRVETLLLIGEAVLQCPRE